MEHFNIGSRKEKEEKTRQREVKIKEGRAGTRNYNEITYRYQFACVISLLDLACMVHACEYLVLLLSLAWVLLGVTAIFNLSLPFPNSHDVMGSHVFD